MKLLPSLATIAAAFLSLAPVIATTPAVRFSTLYGGSGMEIPMALTVDSSGASYIAGLNGSTDLPNVRGFGNGIDAFVAKISPTGASVLFSATIAGFEPRAIAVDASGQIYLAGFSYYAGLPVTNAVQAAIGGKVDAVVVKLSAAGDEILFATYLGGSGDDAALGLAVDPTSGDIWVTGSTASTNFPTAGQPYRATVTGSLNAFLARLSNDGKTLKYSSYFGANFATYARCIALDSLGRPVIAGVSDSTNLPMVGAYQSTPRGAADAFLAKFSANGQSLVYSTFLGGSGSESVAGIGLDSSDNIYLQGFTSSANFPTSHSIQPMVGSDRNIFVTKFSASGASLIYSTYLGSSLANGVSGWPNYFGDNNLPIDVGGIAVAPSGRALVVGTTQGTDFPVHDPLKVTDQAYSDEVFATALNPDGSLLFSTYFGGRGSDQAYATTATSDGAFLVTGLTSPGTIMPDFPVTAVAAQVSTHLVSNDAFLTKLDFATPPLANDAFANAAVIPGTEETIVAQTASATKEAGEPNHAGNAGGKSVWYRWTAPTSGRLILTTRDSSYPTLLALYHGTALNNLQPVASAQADLRQPVTAGETLYIAIDGMDGTSGTLFLSLALSLPPNDDFDDRLAVTGTSATVFGSNVGATGEPDDFSPRTVWWKWIAPVSGDFTVSTLGSSFDTWLLAYVNALQLRLVAFDIRYTNNTSRVTFRATAGSEYIFLVSGDNGQTGEIQLNLFPASPPPNDDFANRTQLTNRNELVTGSDFDVVTDSLEQRLETLAAVPWGSGRIVWWDWLAPIDGALQITTTNTHRVIAPDSYPNTSLIFFQGTDFPTNVANVSIASYDPATQAPAGLYVTDVRAGSHYVIGLDTADYEQPVQFSLRLREIAPPRILAGSGRILGGTFSATAEGIEGSSYRVTASTDLENWIPISTYTNISGQFSFQTPVATQYKFFRVEEITTP